MTDPTNITHTYADDGDATGSLSGLLEALGGNVGGDWRYRAACADVPNIHIFQPVNRRQYGWAVAYCRVCPVSAECAEEGAYLQALSDDANPSGTKNAGIDDYLLQVRGGRLTGTHYLDRHSKQHPVGSQDGSVSDSDAIDQVWEHYLRDAVIAGSYKRKDGPVRALHCDWCYKPYKSVATKEWLTERGSFCRTDGCTKKAREFTVTDSQGRLWCTCDLCHRPLLVSEAIVREPKGSHYRDKTLHGRRCLPCDTELLQQYADNRKKVRDKRLRARLTDPDTGKMFDTCKDCNSRFETKSFWAKYCPPCHDRRIGIREPIACARCGKKFIYGQSKGSARRNSRYCSNECGRRYPRPSNTYETRNCRVCGKQFKTRIKKDHKACSISCGLTSEAKLKHQNTNCLQCGTELKPDAGARTHLKKYCSTKCANRNRRQPRPCSSCLKPLPDREEPYISHKAYFCDRKKCKQVEAEYRANLNRPKEQSPNWTHGTWTCLNCNRPFTKWWNRYRDPYDPKYCSTECARDGRPKELGVQQVGCVDCGKTIKPRSRHKQLHQTGITPCNCKCKTCYAPTPQTITAICANPQCDTEFTYRSNKPRQYCGKRCANIIIQNNRKTPVVTSTCKRPGCDNTYTHKATRRRVYCSRPCANLHLGERNRGRRKGDRYKKGERPLRLN